MPRTYVRRFRVHWTDCNATGHLSHVAYARMVQEVAFDAGIDAGYGLAYWVKTGVGWLARRSHIDYVRPARHGDELDVTTYITRFSRIRAQRDYDFVRASDGAPVAHAAIDWVLFNRSTGAPARLSAEVMLAFRPEGPDPDPGTALDTTRLPDAPPPDAHLTSRRVHYGDMDEYQHVNNAVYLGYLEQAAIDATASAGYDAPRWPELGGLFVIRQHDIEYLRPARYGDALDIATWIGQFTSSSLRRHTTMRLPDGELAIRAQTRWVWVDAASGAASPIPGELLEALRPGRPDE